MRPTKYLFFIFALLFSQILSAQNEYKSLDSNSTINFFIGTKILGFPSETAASFKHFVITAINAEPDKSAVQVQIIVNSLDTGIVARDKHLLKDDFFSENTYKTIDFKSTDIKSTGPNIFTINGILKIKGKEHKLSFNVTTTNKDKEQDIWQVQGEFKLDRQKLGLNYQSPFFLPTVLDEVKVVFDIQLKKHINVKNIIK